MLNDVTLRIIRQKIIDGKSNIDIVFDLRRDRVEFDSSEIMVILERLRREVLGQAVVEQDEDNSKDEPQGDVLDFMNTHQILDGLPAGWDELTVRKKIDEMIRLQEIRLFNLSSNEVVSREYQKDLNMCMKLLLDMYKAQAEINQISVKDYSELGIDLNLGLTDEQWKTIGDTFAKNRGIMDKKR